MRVCLGRQRAGAVTAEGGLSCNLIRQKRIARQRQRPVENKRIGQRIAEPEIGLAAMARAQGIEGLGPIGTTAELTRAVRKAPIHARAGRPVQIDARVMPGYNPATATGMARSGNANPNTVA